VPLDDVAPDALVDGHLTGDGRMRWTVVGGDRRAPDAAWAFADPDGDLAPVAGHVSFEWDRVDWFEEDEQVLVHARDPYTRVDVLASSRLVVVVHGDVVLASSARPFVLFETYAPRRYYLPATDVRTELLEPSATVRHCPYVGVAHYWSARIGSRIVADVAWSYPDPLPEQVKVRDLICFAAEQVDVIVDGRRESVPDPSLRRRP
jgi:uncharacterized protein (DUF427 family)